MRDDSQTGHGETRQTSEKKQPQQPQQPQLRFPDMDGVWEEKKGNQLFESSRGKGNDSLPIYSVTLSKGMVRRDSLDRHMGDDAASNQNLKAVPGDLVYNMMRMWQGAVGRATVECMVSPAYIVLHPKEHIDTVFFDSLLKNKRALYLLWAYSYGLTNDRLRLYFKDFSLISFSIPPLPEQQKIAAFLSAVDARIGQLEAKRQLWQDYKKGMMQRLFSQDLRFKDQNGHPFPDWQEKELGEILQYEQPTKYLVKSSEYQDNFNLPVLTAGKTFILGYTNEKDGIYKDNLPVIIFDDFTTANKYVDFPFKVKSSAMKMLTVTSHAYNLKLVFEFMKMLQFPLGEHKRYWISEFQYMPIPMPHPEEQQKIANCLTALDAKITAVDSQLSHMQTFKKGLLQQLFV